jgi:5-bromo-4-chloroindolyl phosphate hydrolysis protein
MVIIVGMSDKTTGSFRKLLPFAVAAAAAGVAYLIFHGIIFPGIALVLGFVVTRVILFPKPGSPTIRRIGPGADSAGSQALAASGVDAQDLERTLREAKSRQQQIQNEAFRILRPEVRKTVDGIADATGRIIDEVRRDPKDLRSAYQFFGYYLDAALKIIKRYGELAALPGPNDEEKAAMARVEGELETIRAAFEKQLSLLRENNMIDLDVELTVLKKTIEMEGLGGK